MAGIESVIYDVNLPPKLTEVRNLLRPALTISGNRKTAANSTMYFALRTELASFVGFMTTATREEFDETNRANVIDAYNVFLPRFSTIQTAITELLELGVAPPIIGVIEEHMDERSPLHVVAATCLMMLYAVQAARL